MFYVLAVSLPPRVATAAGALDGCEQAGLQLVSVAGGAVPAANQDVTIPKEKVDLAVYTANWRHKLTNAKQVENLVFDLIILNSDKFNSSDGLNILDLYRKAYGGALEVLAEIPTDREHHELIVHTMLTVGLDIPDLAPAMPFVWKELTQRGLRSSADELDEQVADSALRFNLSESLLTRSNEIIARVHACAREIPEVAEAYNKHQSDTRIANILASADKIITDNPDLQLPPEILDAIGADGSMTISLDEVKDLSKEEFDKIHATIDGMQETLAEIDKDQDVIIDYLKDQELKAKYQELMKKKAAENQLKLDAAKASISILTTIAGQIDPKFAKGFNTVATSSLQVGLAINGWLKGISGLSDLASLSTVVMTGNVLGAVMNVVSLFGPAQPTPEQQILEEIGKLRQQVDQLRTEMHGRFDRIDVELNAIYTTMNERFNQIDIQLGKINGNILEVQQALVTLDLKLDRIERTNFELINAVARRPLLEAINGGLGYFERTGEVMPKQPDFINYENQFHSWGTIHVFDPGSTGPTQRDFSDAALLKELTTYPLDVNINFLNNWLTNHGLPGYANEPLPSPRDWVFASRAYAQLAAEWPLYMQEVDPGRKASLDEVGFELETAMNKLSTLLTPSGPLGNSVVYSTVITMYQNKLDQVDAAIQGVEAAFVQEVVANQLKRSAPFDLYGGIDQTLSFTAEGLTQINTGDPAQMLPAPSNLTANIDHFNRFNLAEYFVVANVPQTKATIEAVLLNPKPTQCIEPGTCPVRGDLRVFVGAWYGSVPLVFMRLDAGTVTLPLKNGEPEEATAYAIRTWGGLKPLFEANGVALTPTAEQAQQRATLLGEVAIQLEDRLELYQHQLQQRVLQELSAGPVHDLAVEAAGYKELIDSLVTLGLPRAVQTDEFLHAMLFGNQQLVEDSQIAQTYALSLTQPISGTGLLVNPRLLIGQVADERTATFAAMLDEYLDAITAKTHVEAPDYIASTRRMLDLSARIARITVAPTPEPSPSPSPSPDPGETPEPGGTPGTVRGYLPFVQR
jgi:hypothetical protein